MATLYFEYDDDAGTKYGLPLSESQQSVYAAIVGTLPTGYASLSALQGAVSGALAFPAGLTPRSITITHDFFGSAALPVLNLTDWERVEPTGPTPFPETPVTFSTQAAISASVGEQRLSN